jgi:hypothetical protein
MMLAHVCRVAYRAVAGKNLWGERTEEPLTAEIAKKSRGGRREKHNYYFPLRTANSELSFLLMALCFPLR